MLGVRYYFIVASITGSFHLCPLKQSVFSSEYCFCFAFFPDLTLKREYYQKQNVAREYRFVSRKPDKNKMFEDRRAIDQFFGFEVKNE